MPFLEGPKIIFSLFKLQKVIFIQLFRFPFFSIFGLAKLNGLERYKGNVGGLGTNR